MGRSSLSSWSSSCTSSSLRFLDDDDDVVCVISPDSVGASPATEGSVKFLCSYGGRILPRHTDGTLRYVGGDNRVLSVDRSIPLYELQRKLTELCGREVYLRCQLPSEDLDALVAVTGDDDLANLLAEYDEASKGRLEPLKVRAFLFPKTPAMPPADSRPPPSSPHLRWQQSASSPARVSPTCAPRWRAAPLQASRRPAPAHSPHYSGRHSPGEAQLRHRQLVHNGRHWQ